MKKAIIIYVVGVLIAWAMGYRTLSRWNHGNDCKMTYGNIAFISVISLLSWADVVALIVIEIGDADFWDKQICAMASFKKVTVCGGLFERERNCGATGEKLMMKHFYQNFTADSKMFFHLIFVFSVSASY